MLYTEIIAVCSEIHVEREGPVKIGVLYLWINSIRN
jgi:hypothetical protein